MPLDIVALQNSTLWRTSNGNQFKAALRLWMAAWHEIPAGSLPDDPKVLGAIAGDDCWFGNEDMILRGFEKCSDGRLYHPILCQMVLKVLGTSTKAKASAKARWDKDKNAVAMQGKGKRKEKEKKDGAQPVPAEAQKRFADGQAAFNGFEEAPQVKIKTPESEMFARAREILKNDAGWIVGKLKQAGKTVPEIRSALELSTGKHDPKTYMLAVVRGASGGPKPTNPDMRGIV